MGGGRISDHFPSDEVDSFSSISSSASSPYIESEPSLILTPSSTPSLLSALCVDESLRRYSRALIDLLRSYEDPPDRSDSIETLKDDIIRHRPGDWIDEVGGLSAHDYDIPDVTTLLLVGPRGSGKSSLVNRISRVFEDNRFALDRAQVSHNLSVTDGTCFLQEYMVPRSSKSLCIYDSRSLSEFPTENLDMLMNWMSEGVSHGQPVIFRVSDSTAMTERIRSLACQNNFNPCLKRMVNFVIFVVDGFSVLKSLDGNNAKYDEILAENYNNRYLLFRDDKPVVVMTHGDQLSFDERALVRAHLGEILGIPPSKQIFDIPDTLDTGTELAIIDMLHYSIEHADNNLSYNKSFTAVQGWHFFWRKMDKCLRHEWMTVAEFVLGYLIVVCLIFRWSSFCSSWDCIYNWGK